MTLSPGRAFLTAAFCVSLAAGCKHVAPMPKAVQPPLSIEERQKLQTHKYNAPFDTVFAATIAVFQDLGWNLESVDKSSGIIRASTAKKTDSFGPEDEQDYDVQHRRETATYRSDPSKKWQRWREAVVHTEPWGKGTRQRIVLSLRGALPAMSYYERQGGAFLRRGREVLINAPAVEQTVEVTLPEAYTDLFERIETAVRQRQEAAEKF